MIVTAKYEGTMDEKRGQRVLDAFERCGVRLAVFDPDEKIEPGEMHIGFSDVDWSQDEDGEELEIHFDDHERATRLAAELRSCGLRVAVSVADEV
jgi:hypothetical protein